MAESPLGNSQVEQLLQFAAGVGFHSTAEVAQACPKEQALIHNLLAICTRRLDDNGSRSSAAIAALGGGDISLPLLHIAGSTCGVAQALSLQALKTWAEDHDGCTQTCVRAGGVPLLLSVFSACLPVSAADVAAAYSASLAVILLRSMVREGGDEGAAAFLEANGVHTLIGLLTRLHAGGDARSLCLVLYLLNDVTRRSAEVLDKAVAARAVDKVVEVLRQPVTEATKFAALLLNRWSLAAQHLDEIRGAGSADALLGVLEVCCAQSPAQAATADPETVAYALSAFSIITQDAVAAVRVRLLNSPPALAAFSRAVPLYEQCFKGVGFPHALMSMLLDGPEGAAVVAALASRGLLPLWLAARHVGGQLAVRAAQTDALAAMAALCHPEEALEVSIAAAELAHAYPAPAFLSTILLDEGRLDRLTQAALGELIGRRDSAGAPTTPPAADAAKAALDPAGSSGLEAWTTAAVVGAQEGVFSPGEEVNQQQQQQQTEEEQDVMDADNDEGAATPAPGPRCASRVQDDSELRPEMSMSMSSSLTTPWPGAKTAAATAAAAAGPAPDRAVAALGQLSALARHAAARAAGASLDLDTLEPALKRQRTDDGSMACLAFRREDVGVQRYDTLCFEVGGREVHAVGFVLETHSSFLRGLLSTVGHVGERVVVPALPAFTPIAMHRLFLQAVEWCYTGEVEGLNACPDSAFELWALADFLQIDGLQRHCEGAVSGWFEARPEVVLRSLGLAEAYASAEPLRGLVARHVLGMVVDGERSGEAAMVVAAAAAAGHAETLGAAMAAEMREDLRAAAATL